MIELMTQAQIDADPDAWLAARRELITASEAADLMNLVDEDGDPESFGTPAKVYWRKVLPDADEQRIEWRVGHHFEKLGAELYAERHPEVALTQRGLCVDDELPWLGATYDRIAETADGRLIPIEFKQSQTRRGFGVPPWGEIPTRIKVQVLLQARVAGAAEVRVPVIFTGARYQLDVFVVEIDDEALADIDAIIAAITAFRDDHLLPRIPPPPDWRPVTTDALRWAYRFADDRQVRITRRLARRVQSSWFGLKAAERRWGQAQNDVRAALGTATSAVDRDGHLIAARSVYTPRRVDLAKLRAEYPDVAAECTVDGKQVDKLLVKRQRHAAPGPAGRAGPAPSPQPPAQPDPPSPTA